MRVLHIIQKPQYRGAEIFTCQLANHQKALGMEIRIASIFDGNPKLDWEDGIISLEGNQINRFLDYNAWRNLYHILKAFKPDIIQTNSGDTLKYTVFSKKYFHWDIPVVVRNASEVGKYLKSGLQKEFNNFLYKHVSGVASVSKSTEQDLVKHFPFLDGKTQVIPVGLECKRYIAPIDFEPKNSKHIVHVGAFNFEKNHKYLISTFKKVLHQREDAILHLIGEGPLRRGIEALVEKEQLTSQVRFHGFVNKPLSFIKAADVLVLPSIIEGLPGVLLEALYCKTPVVANDIGGISEIINEDTGHLIEIGNEEKFVTAICESLANPDYVKIDRAYELVTRDYMNKNIAPKFLEFYQAVLQNNNNRTKG